MTTPFVSIQRSTWNLALVMVLSAVIGPTANADSGNTVSLSGTEAGQEGAVFTWNCVWSDRSEEVVYLWDFGDGTTLSETHDKGESVVSHTYANGDATHEVGCEAEGQDSGDTDAATLEVAVVNATPVVTATGVASAEEGQAVTFDCTATDAGIDDELTYRWSFSDGAAYSGASVSHAFGDDGSFRATCTVTDDDDDSGSSILLLAVSNAAPTLAATGDETCMEDGPCSLALTLEDPGSEDTHNWTTSLPDGAGFDESSLLLSWVPTWEQVGKVTASFTVTDDDGGSETLNWTFDVAPFDQDGDGMSDHWELENGLDASDPDDGGSDPDGDGRTNLEEFALGTDPQEDDGPTTPTPWSPADGEEWTELGLELLVQNAESPVGSSLTLRVEVYADEGMTLLLAASEDLEQDSSGFTGWTPDLELTENTWYHWWVVAEDSWTTGSWSAPAAFFYNTVNEAPGAPGLNLPFDGATVDGGQPQLLLDPAHDPDGDHLTYTVVLLDEHFDELSRATGLEEEGGAVSWAVDVSLSEEIPYCWLAWATDEEGLDGETTPDACFLLDATNEAPTAPVIDWPDQDDRVWSLTPTIQVTNGQDPEGRTTQHLFQLDTDSAFNSDDLQVAWISSGDEGTTTWTVPQELADDRTWWLRVTCTDGSASSEQVQASFRVNSANDAPTEPALHNPADGAHVSHDEVFSVVNSHDPDGESLAYEFRITSMEYGQVVAEGFVDENPEGTTSWEPGLLADGWYIWTVRAVDSKDLVSDWALPRGFQAGDEGGLFQGAEPLSFWGCSTTGSGSHGLGVVLLLLGTVMRRRR